jgi:2-iminobutanoate/2-iminopropanoate deaminase
MPQKEEVRTDKAPAPMPFFSQAIKCQGMVYCSGSIGVDPKTSKVVEGNVADRTVCFAYSTSLHRCPSFVDFI